MARPNYLHTSDDPRLEYEIHDFMHHPIDAPTNPPEDVDPKWKWAAYAYAPTPRCAAMCALAELRHGREPILIRANLDRYHDDLTANEERGWWFLCVVYARYV